MKRAGLLALAVFAASCATVSAPSGPAAPLGPAAIPSSPLQLGDWRNAGANEIVQRFEREVNGRYGVGLALAAAVGDLRGNQFSCAASGGDRGDPPDQVCRRTQTQSGCTHTWQVLLYDAGGDGRLARTRALYDRRCGDDGLLGGPG